MTRQKTCCVVQLSEYSVSTKMPFLSVTTRGSPNSVDFVLAVSFNMAFCVQ